MRTYDFEVQKGHLTEMQLHRHLMTLVLVENAEDLEDFLRVVLAITRRNC